MILKKKDITYSKLISTLKKEGWERDDSFEEPFTFIISNPKSSREILLEIFWVGQDSCPWTNESNIPPEYSKLYLLAKKAVDKEFPGEDYPARYLFLPRGCWWENPYVKEVMEEENISEDEVFILDYFRAYLFEDGTAYDPEEEMLVEKDNIIWITIESDLLGINFKNSTTKETQFFDLYSFEGHYSGMKAHFDKDFFYNKKFI